MTADDSTHNTHLQRFDPLSTTDIPLKVKGGGRIAPPKLKVSDTVTFSYEYKQSFIEYYDCCWIHSQGSPHMLILGQNTNEISLWRLEPQ